MAFLKGIKFKRNNYSWPEAGLALAMSTAQIKGIDKHKEDLIRQYYKKETFDSLTKKIKESEGSLEKGVISFEPFFIDRVASETVTIKLRVVAIALEVARIDNRVDEKEMAKIKYFCQKFNFSISDVDMYAAGRLHEIDSAHSYENLESPHSNMGDLVLEPNEAGLALLIWVAFSDDDPSEKEMEVVGQYYSMSEAEQLARKISKAGFCYPDDLPLLKKQIVKSLSQLTERAIEKKLAIAYVGAEADGKLLECELEVIRMVSGDLSIEMDVVKNFFS